MLLEKIVQLYRGGPSYSEGAGGQPPLYRKPCVMLNRVRFSGYYKFGLSFQPMCWLECNLACACR
ncbi:MAG: hypothetical protein JWN40_4848 [Phycisphaerales bacterium]|nr:hypothetical protein [Phycisphaerales bacterium]